jgi:hypothetical protein
MRGNDSGAAIELEGCHVAVGAGSSTPEDGVSICISLIATQDHAFLLSSHYHNNNLQGIQQFPLSALLRHFLEPIPQLLPTSTATTTNKSAIPTFRSRQRSSRQYAKISVSLLSNLKLFSCLRAFSSPSPLSALLSQSTFTTKSTTITSAMGRVCAITHHLADHRLTFFRVDTTRSATPRPTRSCTYKTNTSILFDIHLSANNSQHQQLLFLSQHRYPFQRQCSPHQQPCSLPRASSLLTPTTTAGGTFPNQESTISSNKELTHLLVATTKTPKTTNPPPPAGQWILLSSHLIFPKPALDLPPLASALAAAFTTFLLLQIFAQHSMA